MKDMSGRILAALVTEGGWVATRRSAGPPLRQAEPVLAPPHAYVCVAARRL